MDPIASTAATLLFAPSAAPARRTATGRRKGPNLQSVHAVGSTKRVTGRIEHASWGPRQYADAKAYILSKRSSGYNAKGCFQWIGKGRPNEDGAVATFCKVTYDAQKLFYLVHHEEAQLKPRERIIASCGDKKCLTIQHLSLASHVDDAAPRKISRTAFYTIDEWNSIDLDQIEFAEFEKPQ